MFSGSGRRDAFGRPQRYRRVGGGSPEKPAYCQHFGVANPHRGLSGWMLRADALAEQIDPLLQLRHGRLRHGRTAAEPAQLGVHGAVRLTGLSGRQDRPGC